MNWVTNSRVIYILLVLYLLGNYQFETKLKSVLEFFLGLKGLWEELNSHRPSPMCTCYHRCHCDSIQNAQEYKLKDQDIQFLTGLNDNFSIVKTQVFLMDHLPSINRIYSLVVQEESNHKNVVVVEDNSILVNATHIPDSKHKGGLNAGKPSTTVSTFCNRNEHTIGFCYQKYGHPNFNKNKSFINVSQVDAHISSQAPNKIQVTYAPSNHEQISQAQYNQLFTLLQHSNLNPLVITYITNQVSSSHSYVDPVSSIWCNTVSSHALSSYLWILDTSANGHICSSLKMSSCYYKIKSISVKLPNGNHVIV